MRFLVLEKNWIEMLLAAPYLSFDGVSGNSGPPRVISEIKKSSPVMPREQIRPRISGELFCFFLMNFFEAQFTFSTQLIDRNLPFKGTSYFIRCHFGEKKLFNTIHDFF